MYNYNMYEHVRVHVASFDVVLALVVGSTHKY